MPQPFPITRRLPDGDRLSAAETNAVLDFLQQIGTQPPPTGQDVGVDPSGGPLDFRPKGFWAELTGAAAGNLYGWLRAAPRADGSVTVDPDTGALVDKGSTTVWPAVEVDGREGLVAGGVYWLVPGDGAFMTFTAGMSSSLLQLAALSNVRCDYLGQITSDIIGVYGPPGVNVPAGNNTMDGVVNVGGVGTAGRTVVIIWTPSGGVPQQSYVWLIETGVGGTWFQGDLPDGDYIVTAHVGAGETVVSQGLALPPDLTGVAVAVTP